MNCKQVFFIFVKTIYLKIRILFFGIAKDIVGHNNIIFDLDGIKTIGQFQVFLKEKYVDLKDINSFAFAVNEVYVTSDHQIKADDIIAVIPPVSGG